MWITECLKGSGMKDHTGTCMAFTVKRKKNEHCDNEQAPSCRKVAWLWLFKIHNALHHQGKRKLLVCCLQAGTLILFQVSSAEGSARLLGASVDSEDQPVWFSHKQKAVRKTYCGPCPNPDTFSILKTFLFFFQFWELPLLLVLSFHGQLF